MGRYYSGDIEGKFWFGVQASDDASFFGGEVNEPAEISYYFDKDDLEKIEEGIAKCEKELGTNLKKLEHFFSPEGEGHRSYNDETLSKAEKIPLKEVPNLLQWYARLELGKKILKCVQEQDSCSFDAEL